MVGVLKLRIWLNTSLLNCVCWFKVRLTPERCVPNRASSWFSTILLHICTLYQHVQDNVEGWGLGIMGPTCFLTYTNPRECFFPSCNAQQEEVIGIQNECPLYPESFVDLLHVHVAKSNMQPFELECEIHVYTCFCISRC